MDVVTSILTVSKSIGLYMAGKIKPIAKKIFFSFDRLWPCADMFERAKIHGTCGIQSEVKAI